MTHKFLYPLILVWLLSMPSFVVRSHAAKRNQAVASNVAIHLRPFVMFSDMDVWDLIAKKQCAVSDAGWGGMAEISYAHSVYRNVLVRANLGGGYYQGDATARQNNNKGKYQGYFGELNVGVEYYPVPSVGFYTFFGLGINVNYINILKYSATAPDNTMQFLPFFPIELGYRFSVSRTFDMGIALYSHIGMVDTDKLSLDGYGTYQQSDFSDGYIGLSVDLAFRTEKGGNYSKSKYHRNSRKCHCYPW